MSISWIATVTGSAGVSGNDIDCTATITVSAGDILFCCVSWEDGASNPSVYDTEGVPVNTFTMTSTSNSVGTYLAMGHVLVANSHPDGMTYRFHLDTARAYRGIILMQFRPDGGETVTLDAGPSSDTGSGTSAMVSGNINTGGESDNVLVGGAAGYNDRTINAGTNKIAEIVGDALTSLNIGGAILQYMWYRLITADPGDVIHAQADLSNVTNWCCDILAVKSVAAGEGGDYIRILTIG